MLTDMNKTRILKTIFNILLILSILFSTSVSWMLNTWKHLHLEELIYEITAPLKGTGRGVIISFIQGSIVPASLLTITLIAVLSFLRKNGKTKMAAFIHAAGIILPMILSVVFLNMRLGVTEYIKSQQTKETFIEDHYIDPNDVSIVFPEQKRNLIYIFLESMEITFSEYEQGGGFPGNCIPELSSLALNHECFSDGTTLNGAFVHTATGWTMGGMFAQSGGLPLKIDIEGNSMDTQDNFFPGITTLGDILQDAGYQQTLLLGSDAAFGGRDLYYHQHGSYNIHDYPYALRTGVIPKNYYAFWGYEDYILFEEAKKECLELSGAGQPFNLTLLTVDTHFEDGYVCKYCETDFGDNQYANVFRCSSQQVYDFVEWITRQDFYENTTIILAGDHLTMDGDFCIDVDKNYMRKAYTCIINPAAENTMGHRSYSTMDLFPTTLAAMGVSIEGDRLGLGTNLFSSENTLIDIYGFEYIDEKLSYRSEWMAGLSGVRKNSAELVSKLKTWEGNTVRFERVDSNHIRFHFFDLNFPFYEYWDREKMRYTIEVENENGIEVYESERTGPYSHATKELIPLKTKDHISFTAYLVNEGGYTKKDKNFHESGYYPIEQFEGVLEEESGVIGDSSSQRASMVLQMREDNERPGEWIIKCTDLQDVLTENEGDVEMVVHCNNSYISLQMDEQEDGVYSCRIVPKAIGEELQMEFVFVPRSDREERRHLGLVKEDFVDRADIYQWLQRAADLSDDVVIFVVSQDDASAAMNSRIQNELAALGISIDLKNAFRESFYAVIRDGNVVEAHSTDALSYAGTIEGSGISYELSSAGFEAGNNCSVKIDGVDYSVGKRGLNFVLYDTKEGRVLDAVAFDTCEGLWCSRKCIGLW